MGRIIDIIKEVFFWMVVLITLPIVIFITWWAIRQDDKEDSNEAK